MDITTTGMRCQEQEELQDGAGGAWDGLQQSDGEKETGDGGGEKLVRCKGGREGAAAACAAAAPLRAGAGGRRGWATAAGCQQQGLFFECICEQGGGNCRIRAVHLCVRPLISSWNRTARSPDRLTFAPRLPSPSSRVHRCLRPKSDDPFLSLACDERAKVTPLREIQTKTLKTTMFWF